MFVVCLAELHIAIENKYDYIKAMCRDYITDHKADFCVSVSDEEIQAEDKGTCFDKGYLESLAIYRKIAEKVLAYNGFLLHGVVADVHQCGVAFLARSGVGKSSHARLWKALLKNEMTIINGDKPLVRIMDGKIFAYGTAWAGKENLHTNAKTELRKICFIERAAENACIRLEKNAVFNKLIPQIYMPKRAELFLKTLEFISEVIENAEFYSIQCNTDISAAKIAYERVMQ